MRDDLRRVGRGMVRIPRILPDQIKVDVSYLVDKVKDIKQWIQQISQARNELGGFSICPFAAKSNYKIIECSIDAIEIEDGYDVIIYIINESNKEIIDQWVETYNNKVEDWMFFEDCATYDTFINGLQTNNGKYNLIISQPKDKLMNFREILKKTNYYSYWSPEYYAEIVGSEYEYPKQ